MSKKRLNVNVDKETYTELRLKLMTQGITVTEWIIQKIKEFLSTD